MNSEVEFESICRQCGECCGALDDPCTQLFRKSDGRYVCRVYNERLGRQKTVSGYVFNCVSIREHMRNGTLREKCSYRSVCS